MDYRALHDGMSFLPRKTGQAIHMVFRVHQGGWSFKSKKVLFNLPAIKWGTLLISSPNTAIACDSF